MKKLIFPLIYLLLYLLLVSCNKHLPAALPVTKTLEFTDSKEGWPPRPKGASDFKEVPTEVIEKGLISTELRVQLQEIAVVDQRVAQALGDRFLLLDVYHAEPAKSAKAVSGQYALLYYSYANNFAVQVQITDRSVTALNNIRDFQPVETKEEIAVAARLVAAQGVLPVRDVTLITKGIITEIPKGEKGHGNRVIYLAYMKNENDDLPLYFAVVDLTTNAVLKTGSF